MYPGGENRTVTVCFMWDKAQNADVGGMTVYFYPTDGIGRIWRFDIPGRDGGPVELPTGRYRMLAVNNDLPGITFSGQDSFDEFTANTRRDIGTTVVQPTGMLYGGKVVDVDVSACCVDYLTSGGVTKECPMGVIRCYPDSLSTIYHVTFSNIKGSERLRSASARLAGIASTMKVSTGLGGDSVCATTFPLTMSTDATPRLTGLTSGLGNPAGTPAFTLSITVTRTDGKSFVKNFDVTQQVLNSSTPRNVFINIEGLEIPDSEIPDQPGGDVGLVVGVDGWQVIEIDISTSV